MLTVRIAHTEEYEKFRSLEGQYHYMGETRPAGDTLRMVFEQDGQWVGLMSWGSACYRLKHRDTYIGWTASLRAARQKLIVQNRRFTLLHPKGSSPNLASQCLGLAIRELPNFWRQEFGYEPLLAETFCDMEVQSGTCYRAAGWTPLGMTTGYARSRQTHDYYVHHDRPKTLWVKPLHPDACEVLCATQLPAQCEGGAHSDNFGVTPLNQSLCESLHEALRRVPDPRKPNSHFNIGTLLTLVVFGVMSGHHTLAAIVRHAKTLTQSQRVALGLPRYDRKSGGNYRKTPCYTAFYNLLKKLDPDLFSEVLCAWIRAHDGTLPRQLAIDGKFIRDVVGIISLVDIDTGVPVSMLRASQKEGDGESCELYVAQAMLNKSNLENATVSCDALHCQQATMREMHMSGGEALVQVKGNQKSVLKSCEKLHAAGTPLFAQNQ